MPKSRLYGRPAKVATAIAIIFAVYSLAGFLLIPYLVKTMVADRLAEALGRRTTIESVSFNPYSFLLVIKGFEIKERDSATGVFASFGELRVNLQARSIFKGGITVKEFALDRPYLNIVNHGGNVYNFSDLLSKDDDKDAKDEDAQFHFSFNNIRIAGGNVDFNDLPKKKLHRVSELVAEIPFVSNVPSEVEIFVKPFFSAKVNGTPFLFKGETKPFTDSLETWIDVDVRDMSLPQYLVYSPMPLKFRLLSGLLGADLRISYVQFKDKKPELKLKGRVEFKDIAVQNLSGAPVVSFKRLGVDIAEADVLAQKAHISSVALIEPRVDVVREATGELKVMAFMPSEKTSPNAALAKPKAVEGDASPLLDIDFIEIKGAGLSFVDRSYAVPFKKVIEPLNCEISNFTTAPDKLAGVKLDFRNKSGESLAANGEFSINPLFASINVSAKGIDVTSVQPIIAGSTNLVIKGGRASASGAVVVASKAGGLSVTYKGSASLVSFDAKDSSGEESILKFQSIAIGGLNFESSPLSIVVGSITLSGLHARLAIDRDGALNLAKAIRKAPENDALQKTATKAAHEEGAPLSARIGAVIFKGGRVDFIDNSVVPSYRASVTELGGKVSGLYLDGSKSASFDIKGTIDRYAPIELTGSLNPSPEELRVDARLSLNDLELSPMTPYSGKYIGYEIEKGKLFLDLAYLIEQRKLSAKNAILLDQLTFGSGVDSPHATSLPVKFALGLLKDRRGQIKIDLPLSGSIDDPDFSVAGLIVQVLVNLIEKAVMSPFSLLGSVFGGGEEISFVEFAPGSAALDEVGSKKLDILEAALYDRPGLKLEISGFVSHVDDALSLKEEKLLSSLMAEKLKDMVKAGNKGASLEDAAVGKDEYDEYLWRAYKSAKFKKETNFVGLVKRLPPVELEALLRMNTVVSEDDLRGLASRRLDAVKEYLLNFGRIEPARVFETWPDSLAPVKKEGQKDGRVEFTLK